MLKIFRLYNQNRRIVWLALIIAIFCIAIINLINYAYQEQAQKDMEKMAQEWEESQTEKENNANIVDYDKAAQPLTSGESVPSNIRDEVQNTLEHFVQCVCSGQLQEAYRFLTEECKAIRYPSVESFESYSKYIKDKIYDFQLWSSNNNIYVYQVKFLDDMLSTGRDTSQNYFQDYITVIKKDGAYRVNVNKLIQARELNKTAESHEIQFKLKAVETYLDYEYYEIEITNHTQKEILLDTREKDDTVYVKNSDGLKIRALLYENEKEDLKVASGETKTIKIKFNNTFNAEKTIHCVGFSNIILDQEAEQKNTEIEIYLN